MASLIEKVVLRYADEQLKTRVSWRGSGARVQLVVQLKKGKERVGHLIADMKPRLPECERDVESLRSRGLDSDEFWVIQNTFIDKEYRGQGFGKVLYETAFQALRKKRGQFFVAPYACSMGSGTSPDAKRVWTSLSSRYPSSGHVLFVK